MVTCEREVLARWRCPQVKGQFEGPQEIIKRDEKHALGGKCMRAEVVRYKEYPHL